MCEETPMLKRKISRMPKKFWIALEKKKNHTGEKPERVSGLLYSPLDPKQAAYQQIKSSSKKVSFFTLNEQSCRGTVSLSHN